MSNQYAFLGLSTLLLSIGAYWTFKFIIRRTDEFSLFKPGEQSLKTRKNSLISSVKLKYLRYTRETNELIGITPIEILLDILMKAIVVCILPLMLSQLMGLSAPRTLLLLCLVSLSFCCWIVGYRKRLVKHYRDEFSAEFADFVESLSLAVNSGLPFLGAVSRVIKEYETLECEAKDAPSSKPKLRWVQARLNIHRKTYSPPIIRELRLLQHSIGSGHSAQQAFDALSSRICSSAVSNFADLITVNLTRGTPIAGQLNEYALSLRELYKRTLLERAGRAEVKMMIPVVFLLLPISVLFALWPSFQQLQQLVITP